MSIFGGSKGGSSPPVRSDSDIQAEALKERRRRALAIGRSATILGAESDDTTELFRTALGTKTNLGS